MELPSTSEPVERDGPVVRALRRAFGARENSEEVLDFLRALSSSVAGEDDRKKFGTTTTYVNHRYLGVSMCFENGTLDTVHAYGRTNKDGYVAYAGELPVRGVTMRSTARDVVKALGEPTSKGGAGRMIWLSYEHLGIKFDIAATNWDEPDAELVSVAIWDPDGD